MFDNPILKNLMDRFGHIEELDQLQDVMRRDGFGEFIDAMNDNPAIMDSFLEEHREEIEQSLRHYKGSGTMSAQEPVQGRPLGVNDAFKFDPGSCLTDCDGKCCKDRNYLMLSYRDIFRLLASPAAGHLNIYSTCDLFDRKPPIIEPFAAEEYDLFLPYLRFLPVGADPDTRPEDAGNSICPFLYPIADVFAFHKLQLPENTSCGAMGCMLMDNKPMICRLSPVAQNRGMITGRLSYEYMEPTRNCPGCATDIEIPLASYIRGVAPSSEERERELFHEMVMAHHASCNQGQDQQRFNSVLLEFYNIDHFLSLYGYTHMQRTGYTQLMEILIAAAEGDFALYDDFHQSLIHQTHGKIKASRLGRASEPDAAMERDFFDKIMTTISGFRYSVEPFLIASKKMNVYENFFELENFYYHDWQGQPFHGARGLCQHLSMITHNYLSDLTSGDRTFSDYYDIYYATGVHESKFFSWPYGNHICLIVFEKGETGEGWIIDPSLKEVIRCSKALNDNRNIIDEKEVYTTDSSHRYLISATIGSSIRSHLEIKENSFTDYSASFDSYLPLFIYKDESLVLAKFRRKNDAVFVEYYEHKASADFSRKGHVARKTTRYQELYHCNKTFSTVDSLLANVSIIDSSQVDQHQRLASTELEEDFMMILYYIELAVIETYQEISDLTDRIVANVLNELISRNEDRIYRVDYLKEKEENAHRTLLARMNSFNLESTCPKRILINALKQVLGSVRGFIKQGAATDAYLKFIIGYFKKMGK